MTSTEKRDDTNVVELIVRDSSLSEADAPSLVSEEITPLLTPSAIPKINIFTVSYPRKKPREQVTRLTEAETSSISQFISWVWSGSRYSGLLCMVVSSTLYFIMAVLSNVFSVQTIPLFETAFARCMVIFVASYLWLRRSDHRIFGPENVRKLLISRAILGYISLMSFIYCIQKLPLSQANALSFTTPVMASFAARIILNEKLKTSEIGGLACSFFGILFIFQQVFTTEGGSTKIGEEGSKESNHMYAILVGLISSITGGISYCLIRAGSKASDQPMVTVFSFGMLATPAAGICSFAFEDFVFPSIYSFSIMLVVGALAFFAEVFLARGLHLEKTSKVVNVLYLEAALSHLWGIGLSSITPFARLVGSLLIVISVSYTMYMGPDKEME